jgi:hypothetical protein
MYKIDFINYLGVYIYYYLYIEAIMSDFESTYQRFLKSLENSPYELPSEMYPFFRSALQTAGFGGSSIEVSSSNVVVKAPRKMSGYNYFMKEKMRELKEQAIASGQRMGLVSVEWKKLTDGEKLDWKTRAGNLTVPAVSGVTAASVSVKAVKAKREGPAKLSGYQMFVKDRMPVVKADVSVTSKSRMGAIGKLWKELSEADHLSWKSKADAYNLSGVLPSSTPVEVGVDAGEEEGEEEGEEVEVGDA